MRYMEESCQVNAATALTPAAMYLAQSSMSLKWFKKGGVLRLAT
jgi:hypothetical protein